MNDLSSGFLCLIGSIRIVFRIWRNFDTSSVSSSKDVVPAVRSHINVFTSHQCSNFRVLIKHSESLSFRRVIISKIDYIVSSSPFVLFTSSILFFHILESSIFSFFLAIHKLPSRHVSFKFLNSKVKYHTSYVLLPPSFIDVALLLLFYHKLHDLYQSVQLRNKNEMKLGQAN
jgi:hypothetical protein